MNTKECYRCRQIKLLSEFYTSKSSKDGRRSPCIECLKKEYKPRPYTERTNRLQRQYNLIKLGFNECSDCKKVKPLSEFYVRPEYKTGYCPRCKECSVILESKNREHRRVEKKNTPTTKQCTKCHKVKRFDEFSLDTSRLDGLACWCKDCCVRETRLHRRESMKALSPTTSKICSKCKTEKPVSEFRISKASKNGYCSWCIECERAYRKEHSQAFPDSRKMAHRITRYGITNDEYSAILESQNNVCAICGQPETKTHQSGRVLPLSIDHNHALGTGIQSVRGLLCNECNSGLGRFRDDPVLLVRAAEYLIKHEVISE